MSEFSDKVEKIVADALRQALDDIPNEIKSGVRETVARVLGFTNSWSRKGWEVDHCNGRNSHVGTLVSETAKKKVEDIIMAASEKFKPSDAQIKAVEREMESVFWYEFKSAMKKELERQAATQAQELVKKMLPDLTTTAFDMAKSLINPDFGSKELEKLAMELHVEKVEGV